ncbi:DUF5713 family protein [Rufibacter sp. LB8]|nr:DUF5713 family protein [Rufibacter sp. LB8]
MQEPVQTNIKNETLRKHSFLQDMYADDYFPDFLVDKGKAILIQLCLEIEKAEPKTLDELYTLTHTATEKFNDLEDEFSENGSEIETAARENIAMDFEAISNAYGFEADVEELIAPRNW